MQLSDLWQPFVEFQFMRRALLAEFALALGATPIGVFMMLRRVSLAGDAIAHSILPGAAIGYAVAGFSLGAMTLGGFVTGLIVALLAGGVARWTMLREDASMAAFYLISLAIGVVLISSHGRSVDLLSILFGSVLAINNQALLLLASVASVSLLTLMAIYRPLVLECYDSGFLRSVSRLSAVTHFCFLILLVLNLIAGFQTLGTLMALGMLLLPAVAARFWSRKLDGMLLAAFLIAVVGCWGGLMLSYYFDLPAGAATVLVLGGMYLLSMLLARDGLITQAVYRRLRHLRS